MLGPRPARPPARLRAHRASPDRRVVPAHHRRGAAAVRVEFLIEGGDAPREWIFTFGYGHTDPRTGESLADCYCRISGSFTQARELMVEMFGVKWAFQYGSEADAGVG